METKKIIIPKDVLLILLLVVLLSLGRVVFFEKYSFIFLFWNLFLACIPFFISSLMVWYVKQGRAHISFMVFGWIAWMLFFPNAPYVVTDLIHVGRIHSVPVFYDLTLLFSAAWAGLLVGLYSLSHIEELIRMKYSLGRTHAIIVGILLISSFGMYLGRFIRFNSWNVLTNPEPLFGKVWDIISRPYAHQDTYVFTLFFFIFMYLFYNAWKYGRNSFSSEGR